MPILNNAVPMAVHNQIRWERDQAMQQLKDHGIPFGGVAPDVVEVVRCRDCKHYKTQNKSASWNHNTLYCMRSAAVKVKPDDFCSYGVRREKDG